MRAPDLPITMPADVFGTTNFIYLKSGFFPDFF
jgi:hypothetical protein